MNPSSSMLWMQIWRPTLFLFGSHTMIEAISYRLCSAVSRFHQTATNCKTSQVSWGKIQPGRWRFKTKSVVCVCQFYQNAKTLLESKNRTTLLIQQGLATYSDAVHWHTFNNPFHKPFLCSSHHWPGIQHLGYGSARPAVVCSNQIERQMETGQLSNGSAGHGSLYKPCA